MAGGNVNKTLRKWDSCKGFREENICLHLGEFFPNRSSWPEVNMRVSNCSWSVPYGVPVHIRCSLCVRNLIISCLLAVYQMVQQNPVQRASWDEYSWWRHALRLMRPPLNFLTTRQGEVVCFTLGNESWDFISWTLSVSPSLIPEVDKDHLIRNLTHIFYDLFPSL